MVLWYMPQAAQLDAMQDTLPAFINGFHELANRCKPVGALGSSGAGSGPASTAGVGLEAPTVDVGSLYTAGPAPEGALGSPASGQG